VVLLAALLDKAVSMGTGAAFEAVAGATCLWFIASEGFSILENVAAMGIPIPKILRQALELLRSKGEPEEKHYVKEEPAEKPAEEAADDDEKPHEA
jgi:phage-related holin